jgi:hypothetical protein
VERPGGRDADVPGIGGGFDAVSWQGRGTALVAQLACTRTASPCGKTDRPHIRVKRLVLTLRDRVNPRVVGLGGSLLASGTQRGDRTLGVRASDVGGGVRRIIVQVNGGPVSVADFRASGDCRLEASMGTRLVPCPLSTTANFQLDTGGQSGRAGPYRQGPNRLRVCAADQALEGSANSGCRKRAVWLDNACPVAGPQGVARLTARFAKGGKRPRARVVTQGRGAKIVGRALSASGQPVAGASLCVGQHLKHPRTPERIVRRALETGQAGRFSLHVSSGGSRLLRIAHWSSATQLTERRLHLNVRARPKLRLRPRRVLENGETLHFKVDLKGRHAGRERVLIKVRPPGGEWQLVSQDCIGRARPSGKFGCRYRFTATTGRRTYAFRAVVPKQPGYPYLRGHSATRRQTVVGP